MLKKTLFLLTALLLVVTVTVSAEGQKEEVYPDKSIDFLIPFGAGGSADVLGRSFANEVEKVLDAQLVPVNQVGGGGAVMYQNLVNSKADGYTIGWSSTSVLTVTAIGNVPFGYDAMDTIARVGYTAMPIAVRADAPYDTLAEFVEYAQAHPGIKIGNAGTGSGTHLVAVAFDVEAELNANHIPLGADRRIASLLGGEVDAICVPLPEIAPHALSGDARILALPTLERDNQFPDVPTMQEEGYDVVIELFRSLSVPKGTPQDRVDMLLDAFETATYSEGFKDTSEKFGFVLDFMAGDELKEYLAAQNEVIVNSMKQGGLVD
jgi:tripartite-type tricarboxylate transporter receptor subunit TctC